MAKTKNKSIHRQRFSNPNATNPSVEDYRIDIRVIGIGGGGGNAISRMRENLGVRGVELIAVNTDAQDLDKTNVRKKIHIGKNLTRGLGTGMNPDLGRQAAEENRSDLTEALKGADLVFITAGLGGGTGSGASPIVAELAREMGALTVAIVTRPFAFEGSARNRISEEAIARLREKVDALIVVPNDRIFNVIKKDTPILKAFERIDDILRDAISGIAELISSTGIINVDFSDVKTIMKDAGSALIGVGIASGQTRAITATASALNSPLLEFSTEGARGILFGVSGGRDMKMTEINEIAKAITANIDPSAKVIFGAYHDRKLKKGMLKVTLIATGFGDGPVLKPSFDRQLSNLFNPAEEKFKKEPSLPLPVEKPQPVRQTSAPVTPKKVPSSIPPAPIYPPQAGPTLIKETKKEKVAPILEDKKKTDVWEIPSFLRRKKRS